MRKTLLPARFFSSSSSSWCLSRACLGKAASTFATCNLSHQPLFCFRRLQGFTIGACPIEGIAPKTECGGEANVNFGDICTGGLYTYDVPSGTWRDNFLTNKDCQVKELFQFDIDRGGKFIPSARNDAVQWSERPMGAKQIHRFVLSSMSSLRRTDHSPRQARDTQKENSHQNKNKRRVSQAVLACLSLGG